MHPSERIFVVPWDGDREKNHAVVRMMYPYEEIIFVEKSELRQSSLRQLRKKLRQFRGKAVVYCFGSLQAANAPLMLAWTGLFHRCRETVLVDEAGARRVYGRWDWISLLGATLLGLACDALWLFWSVVILRFSSWKACPLPISTAEVRVAYLFPHPTLPLNGGAGSHARGLLGGLRQAGIDCQIYTGQSLGDHGFSEQVVPLPSHSFFFWEARALRYNWQFLDTVAAALHKSSMPTVLYQRHSRFTVSGALLSRRLSLPLVLEYNGPEAWVASNWDPSKFRPWLRMCEDYSLQCASLITVVSEALRRELSQRGIADEKIVVIPNGVDPAIFQPGCGGAELRRELGIAADEIVACFVGSFSYWHGIPELQEAADRLLRMAEPGSSLARVRFMLVGDGPLRHKAETSLREWVKAGKVIFTGSVPHGRVPSYLDAADILLSPHVPFADGSEFFGSPTKLFEYMAMGKAIVASNLGQIGDVLSHQRTGWLIRPGNVDELVAAIAHLAGDPPLREGLGRQARAAAIANYSWRRNAETVLTTLQRVTSDPDRKQGCEVAIGDISVTAGRGQNATNAERGS